MLNLTNTIVNTLSRSKVNLIEETRTMYMMHRNQDDILSGYSENEQCDYIFIDTDNYAKLMRPLDSNENVKIMCSEEDTNVFTIMVPVWKRELSQSTIDFIFTIGEDVMKKANLIPPIPYYIWVNDMVLFASVEMNTNPCVTNLDKILSAIDITDKCATKARNYLERYLGI